MSGTDGSVSERTEICSTYSYDLQIHLSLIEKKLAIIVSSPAEDQGVGTCSTCHEEIAAISIDSTAKFQFISRASIFQKEEIDNNKRPIEQYALE
jgi:hypothetical protein